MKRKGGYPAPHLACQQQLPSTTPQSKGDHSDHPAPREPSQPTLLPFGANHHGLHPSQSITSALPTNMPQHQHYTPHRFPLSNNNYPTTQGTLPSIGLNRQQQGYYSPRAMASLHATNVQSYQTQGFIHGNSNDNSNTKNKNSSSSSNSNNNFRTRKVSPLTFANYNGSNTSRGIQNNTQRSAQTTGMRPTTRIDLPTKALLSTIVRSGKGKVKGHQKPKSKRGPYRKTTNRKKKKSKKKSTTNNLSLCWEGLGLGFPWEMYCLLEYSASYGYKDTRVTNETEYEIDWEEAKFERFDNVSAALAVGTLNKYIQVTNEAEYESVRSDGPNIPLPAKIQAKSNPAMTELKKNSPTKVNSSVPLAVVSHNNDTRVTNETEYESDYSNDSLVF